MLYHPSSFWFSLTSILFVSTLLCPPPSHAFMLWCDVHLHLFCAQCVVRLSRFDLWCDWPTAGPQRRFNGRGVQSVFDQSRLRRGERQTGTDLEEMTVHLRFSLHLQLLATQPTPHRPPPILAVVLPQLLNPPPLPCCPAQC